MPLRVCDRESDPLEAWATVLPLSSVKRLLTVLAARERVLVTKIEAIAGAVASGAVVTELARRRREREENSPSAA